MSEFEKILIHNFPKAYHHLDCHQQQPVMKQADRLVDVGPDDGVAGEKSVFTGTPEKMVAHRSMIMADHFRKMAIKDINNYFPRIQPANHIGGTETE